MKSKYVFTIVCTDPDSKLPVEIEVRKLEDGTMVGLDCAVLEADEDVYSPYTKNELIDIPDEETTLTNWEICRVRFDGPTDLLGTHSFAYDMPTEGIISMLMKLFWKSEYDDGKSFPNFRRCP